MKSWEKYGFVYSNDVAKVKIEPKDQVGSLYPSEVMEMEVNPEDADLKAGDVQEADGEVESNNEIAQSAEIRKKKYKRYSRFKPKWKTEKQVSEISALRAPDVDGSNRPALRDYLILTSKKSSSAISENYENFYDLMGCAACQMDCLRDAYKAKDRSRGARGNAARDELLKRTEITWAAGVVRSQHDKIAAHEKSGMHKFCYPRWARSKHQSG